jgi:hypothetical protein
MTLSGSKELWGSCPSRGLDGAGAGLSAGMARPDPNAAWYQFLAGLLPAWQPGMGCEIFFGTGVLGPN